MNKRKLIINILIIVSILTSCFINTYAKDTDKLILQLNVGSNVGKINGTASKVEKPYISNKTIMVPLSWFANAIGAELNQKADKKIEIIYGDMNAEIQNGNISYTANTVTYKHTIAPVTKNGRTMVPLEFISKNFPVSVTSDIKKGSIKIILEDDGALSDLSFLTGGISSAKLGNSYYGWSINVPSGSRIISNSFKSDKIGITNESRSLYFEISVESKKDRTLSELYNDVLYSSSIRESKLDLKAKIPYFQYIRLTEYEESLRVKVFEKGEYFYYVTINSYDNSVTPEELLSDKYYDNIVSSFNLDYKGNVKGVEDISKIKDGEVSFYNYVSLNSDAKYLPWSMNIPVKWNQVLSSNDPLTTNLGIDSQHYMKITMNTLEEGQSLDNYVENIKKKYDKYFNPKKYSFISSDLSTIANTDALNLKFSIKQADKVYIMDELYFIKDGFVYEVSIELPENEYEKSKAQFIDTLNKITFYSIDEKKYQKDLEKYINKNLQVRVSQQDETFEYINKTYKWSANIPGYWTKSGSEDNATTFDNPNTNANIIIYTLENNSLTKTLSDEEKFGIMNILKSTYGATPTQSITNEKGYQVRTYTYKVENFELDLFANITCYCFESGKYSYCYLSNVPDLTATEDSVKEINDIWKAFKITE
jgi:hypothetical protein